MQKYNDYPIEECAKQAEKIAAKGGKVYQKFTCDSCGSRLTIDTPDVFHTSGSCDRCGYVTDLSVKGCNYLVSAPGSSMLEILKLMGGGN